MSAEPCADMHLLVQAELDGELDAAGAASLAAHVAVCAGCAELQADLGSLSNALRDGIPRHTTPAALRRTIMAQLPARELVWIRRSFWRDGLLFGTGLATAAATALLLLPLQNAGLTDEIVAAHIRGLQPGHLVEVQSTDQHTVKPWFDGRLDYAPPVHDFAAKGFPLVGGRLDYVGHRPVAVLIYGRDKHLIDVFVWPGGGGTAERQIQGYNVESWSQDGMVFQAVSDLNVTELSELASLLQGEQHH